MFKCNKAFTYKVLLLLLKRSEPNFVSGFWKKRAMRMAKRNLRALSEKGSELLLNRKSIDQQPRIDIHHDTSGIMDLRLLAGSHS
jgi:CDP-diacylglycerol pyrophosphatase